MVGMQSPIIVEPTAKNHSSQIKPYLTNLSSSKAAWNGIIVERNLDLATDAHEVISPAHLLAIHYGRSATLEWMNDRTKRELFTKGDININPFGNSVKPQWQQPAEFILLALEPQFLARVAQESVRGGQVEMFLRFKVRDPLIEQIAIALITEVEQGELTNRLYAESLTNALAFHLVKHYSTSGSNIRVYKGGLSPQMQTAINYINHNLNRTISLAEIADAVGVSSHHFARAFKQSTGIAPHKYLTQRRLECAKSLLSDPKVPLAEIAFRLGFSSQAHFTTVFRQSLGITPKSYSKAL